MSLPSYPEYKDSGVDWLEKVPANWSIAPLKCCFMIYGGSTPKSDETSFWDGEIVWVSPADLSKLSTLYINDSARKITYAGLNSCGTTLVPEGSIVLSTRAPIGSLAIAKTELCTNQGCKSLVPKAGIDELFYAYCLLASTKALNLRGKGTTFLELSADELGAFKVPLPPFDEQAAVAAFLNRETGKIDALISEQEKLLILLAEKRQATISYAVTRGLSAGAPMKESGTKWLQKIPSHWDVRTIAKCTTKITNGYVGPTRDILVDEGVPYIQATHIKNGRINFGNDYFVTREWSQGRAKSILEDGDVLIVQTGAGTGDVGLVSSQEAGFNCHALIILSPDPTVLSGAFLCATLQSTYGRETLASIQTGAMHPHLNCGEVKFVDLPVPPLVEQAKIVDFILSETAKLDALKYQAERAIKLLTERRAALIAAAVTGKVDVRNAASEELAA
ncbi:Type I restriction modification DNA specificity domain protein [Paraburkholderia ribeironis]|uniref:Type I restriction modification DNA specificity domain protein n=1 Tax=Paraburkholderia ribeironis TaxID=1247936 RepID=A0A1N7RN95_9BURK|nr:restriction endonuclease subunit S [Paraburkholderia ribeironis]SIT36582.1 Type I restriction modification DNA specificity domain protein [Paraburkholderia ribeironis]